MGDETGYGRSLQGTLLAGGGASSEIHLAVTTQGIVHWAETVDKVSEATASEAARKKKLIAWQGMKLSWSDAKTITIKAADRITTVQVGDAEAFLTRLERYGSADVKGQVNRLWQEAEQRTERHPLTHVGVLVVVMLVCIGLWHSLTYVEAAIVDYCVPMNVEAQIARHVEPNFLGGRKKADPKLIAAVQQILDRLVAQWPKKRQDLFKETMSITVINDKTINAFALPAGRILVFSGLIAAAKRPSQVAAVVAHELSHVHHRDGMKRIAGQVKWRILYAYLAGDMSADQEFILQRAESLSSMKYSRSMEERADREGLELMIKAGFDGRAAAEFFTIMYKKGPNILDTLNFLSDHPATPERIKHLQALYKEMEAQGLTSTCDRQVFEGDWEEIRRLARQGVNK